MAASTEKDIDLTEEKTSTTGQDVSVQDVKMDKLSPKNQGDSDGTATRVKVSNDNDVTTDEEDSGHAIPNQNDVSAEPPSEQDIQRVVTAGEDYSVLSVGQKKLIIVAASLASLFSPMATAIYC